jgi:hypothetical protein
MRSTTVGLACLAVHGVASGAFPGAAGNERSDSIEGVITARDATQLTVSDAAGSVTAVTLSDATHVRAINGVLRLRRQTRPVTDLIAGLPVKIEGTRRKAGFDAARIGFLARDLRAAVSAKARAAPGG